MPSFEDTIKFVTSKFGRSIISDGCVGLVDLVDGEDGDQHNLAAALLEVMNDGLGPYSKGQNKRFKDNGHDDLPSWETKKFLVSQILAKSTIAFATGFADAGVVRHGAAGWQRASIWVKINGLYKSMLDHKSFENKDSRTDTHRRIDKILSQKGYGFAGDTIRTATAVFSLHNPVVGSVIKAGISQSEGTMNRLFAEAFDIDVEQLAQEIHWRAFQEQVVGRLAGKGPATRIVEILWGQIGPHRAYSMVQVIREPCGWTVLQSLID